MYIGNLVIERMNQLGLTISDIEDQSLIEKDIILKIINNKIQLNDIDFLDLEFLAGILKINVQYFFNQDVRNKDILNCIGTDNKEVNRLMAQMQLIVGDFEFLTDINREEEF